ncbi:MAG: ATP synthase F0 subunit B [Myxococcota bacterium]
MHSINWWGLGSAYQDNPAIGWMLVTFFIFLGFLWHFAKKPVATYLQNRSDEIRLAIEEGRRARLDAEAKLQECERRLLELDNEIARMKSDFLTQGELERNRLKLEAEQIALQIQKDSQQTLKAEVTRALHELKQEIAAKILTAAESNLPLGEALDTKLYANFVRDTTEGHA